MQGSTSLKYLAFSLIPLMAACTTPTRQSAVLPAPPLQFDNCAVGCPTGGSPVTLNRQAYTLNNNGSTKFANWVSYKITKASAASGRSRDWRTDPDIPAGETLDPVDYNGANVALKIDRGHQANLASMAGVADWQTLNYLSNITPQKAELNQGRGRAWKTRSALSARSQASIRCMWPPGRCMSILLARCQVRTKCTPSPAAIGKSSWSAVRRKRACTPHS